MSAKIELHTLLVPFEFNNLFTDFVNNKNNYACSSPSAILFQVDLD